MRKIYFTSDAHFGHMFALTGRVNLMNREITVLRGGRAETSVLPDRSALRAVLAEHFGFDLPEAESIRVPSVPDWA